MKTTNEFLLLSYAEGEEMVKSAVFAVNSWNSSYSRSKAYESEEVSQEILEKNGQNIIFLLK